MEEDPLKEKLKRIKRERDALKTENAQLREQINSGNPIYKDMHNLSERSEFEISRIRLNYTLEGFLEFIDIFRTNVLSQNYSAEAKDVVMKFFDDAVNSRKIVEQLKNCSHATTDA